MLSRFRYRSICRVFRWIWLLPVVAVVAGCPTSRQLPDPAAADVRSQGAQPQHSATSETRTVGHDRDDPQTIVSRIADVLAANLHQRTLSTDVNAAWQTMHGVLAYGRDLKLQTAQGAQPAVEYLFAGGAIRGFQLRGGDRFEIDGQPVRGIVAEMDPGQKIGQGHRDQWLAYMARCQLQADDTVVTADGPLTVAGWIRQMEWDLPRNFESEFSWTLTALLAHRPTTHRWTARDGKEYNIESLLQSELQQLASDNACGGSHRLAAIAGAVRKRQAEGQPVSGVWADAAAVVEMAIEQTRQFQNRDGSFSSHYFDRPGWSPDLVAGLGTTGHVFEFLAIAGDDELLQQPWVQRAAVYLCDVLEQTAAIDMECGALYHALSGMSVYHNRCSTPQAESAKSLQTAAANASTAAQHTTAAK